jgi:hypothetical protein
MIRPLSVLILIAALIVAAAMLATACDRIVDLTPPHDAAPESGPDGILELDGGIAPDAAEIDAAVTSLGE